MSSSNIGWVTKYRDRGSSWCSSVPPRDGQGGTLNKAMISLYVLQYTAHYKLIFRNCIVPALLARQTSIWRKAEVASSFQNIFLLLNLLQNILKSNKLRVIVVKPHIKASMSLHKCRGRRFPYKDNIDARQLVQCLLRFILVRQYEDQEDSINYDQTRTDRGELSDTQLPNHTYWVSSPRTCISYYEQAYIEGYRLLICRHVCVCMQAAMNRSQWTAMLESVLHCPPLAKISSAPLYKSFA
jgi:hypothetical protein